MSSCYRYEELISAMIDGEISAAEEKELMKHIAECPSCKKMYDTYKAVFSSFDDVMAEPPAELKENIMASVKVSGEVYTPAAVKKEQSAKPAAKRAWVKYAAAAACFVVIVAAVPSILSGSKSAAPEAADKFEGVFDMTADMPADEPTADAPAALPDEEPAPPEAPFDGPVAEVPAGDRFVGDSSTEEPAEEPEADIIIDPSSPAVDIPADEPMTEDANVCTVRINGDLPDILAGETLIDNGDGSFRIYIAPDTAMTLTSSGYEIKYSMSPDLPVHQYVVIYTP